MASRLTADHDCATYLYGQGFRTLGDTVICRCGSHWVLCEITRLLAVMWWRWHDSQHGGLVWVRDKPAERAARREQTLKAREWRRS